MNYYLELKEEAVDELSEVYQFYENEKEGLGEDFLAVLDESFSRIKEHPHQYPEKYKNKRVAV